MIKRQLGSSGMHITSIGIGTWAIGGHLWGGQDDTKSIEAIHAALDHGINWIDTAPIYGSGHSEAVVGRAVKSLSSDRRPFVFTKCGLGQNSDEPTKSASAAEVADECDASLRRLGVDAIDLYQLHWPVPQPIAETAGAFAKLLQAGKIRAIGVSNFSVSQLEEWRATGVPLHSDQPPFSILRPAAGKDVLPWCAANGVGAICTRRCCAACCLARGAATRPSRPATAAARTRTIRDGDFSGISTRSTSSTGSPARPG